MPFARAGLRPRWMRPTKPVAAIRTRTSPAAYLWGGSQRPTIFHLRSRFSQTKRRAALLTGTHLQWTVAGLWTAAGSLCDGAIVKKRIDPAIAAIGLNLNTKVCESLQGIFHKRRHLGKFGSGRRDGARSRGQRACCRDREVQSTGLWCHSATVWRRSADASGRVILPRSTG